MVFWATVLSFIVGIMLALIYPRSDKHLVENVPLAESFISAFVTQHQSARNYANAISLALPYIETSQGIDFKALDKNDVDLDSARHIHVFKEDFNQQFLPTIAPLDGHMAPSYNLFPTPDKFRDGTSGDTYGYTSSLICLDKVDDPLTTDAGDTTITNWERGKIISCKTTNQNTFKYVVTYGLLYQNEDNNSRVAFRNKRLLWEKALTNRIKNTIDCGYVDTAEGTTDGEPRIMTINGEGRKIPQAIYNFYQKYISENGDLQPLFCITPIKTPYITDSLLYHFDSFINQIDASATLSHTPKKTGWTNIVTQQTTGFIGDTGHSWHPDDLQPLGLRGGHGLHLPIDNPHTKLDNTFTISFVLKFITKNDDGNIIGEMPLLGSTQSGIYPNLYASYDPPSRQLTFSLQENNWRNYGSFSSTIGDGIVSITYIVTPQAHYLYVDGRLAKHEKYANNSHLSKLETVTLAIGEDANTTTKLSADIYNIKVYNRALNEQEIQYNYNTDKKRFNF